MGDSQNWSSFDEPSTVRKPAKKAKKEAKAGGDAAGSSTPLLSAANVRQLQQRLMFGAIVGFCTGATFGTSAFGSVLIDTLWLYHRSWL